MMVNLEKRLKSAHETLEFGRKLAKKLVPGDILLLQGEIGAGKTTFIKGLAKGLGIKNRVLSPTFVLVRSYQGRIILHHADLYRLDRREAMNMGLEDYMGQESLLAVEWADRVPRRYFPHHALLLQFRVVGLSTRSILLSVRSKTVCQRIKGL